MVDLVRRDLECGDADALEEVNRLLLEGGREELDAGFRGVRGQGGVPFPRDLNPLDEIPDRLALADKSLVLEVAHVGRPARVEAFGRVCLELHRIGTRLGSGIDEPERGIEIAVVVRPGFSDDVARVTGSDGPVADAELRVAVSMGAHESRS
jgi:hypothetical protein